MRRAPDSAYAARSLAGSHSCAGRGPVEVAAGAGPATVSGYAPGVQTLTVALAQIAPRLGMFDANLGRHYELIEEARGRGAGLAFFPEVDVTGSVRHARASEVALRLADPRLAGRAEATHGLSAVVSFVE